MVLLTSVTRPSTSLPVSQPSHAETSGTTYSHSSSRTPLNGTYKLKSRSLPSTTLITQVAQLSPRSSSSPPGRQQLPPPTMKTSKVPPPHTDLSSHRRAQPVRQTRTNPPRTAIPGIRPFGSRGSLSGGLEEKDIEIFPAITHFADAITALPKELVRHFTLLKEVDAKIYAPEEQLHRLVAEALNAPLPPPVNAQPLRASTSAQGSVNGSAINGYPALVADQELTNSVVYDAANLPRRQLFQNCAITMQNMLVALDEKNHVISTAGEALNKQLARLDDCLPYIDLEISEEARYGSTVHWAYPENRVVRATNGGNSRREAATVNTLSAAAQLMVDEAAARSDARKQAIAEKKKGKQQAESDFDDQEKREKKVHGNSKIRKAAESAVGLGITNGATNGNPPKRRKVEKGPTGGAVMERSISSVMNNAVKKVASPRATPVPEGTKKRSRAVGTNGHSRKRYVAPRSHFALLTTAETTPSHLQCLHLLHPLRFEVPFPTSSPPDLPLLRRTVADQLVEPGRILHSLYRKRGHPLLRQINQTALQRQILKSQLWRLDGPYLKSRLR